MIKRLLTITAPSCSGKSTTANVLASNHGYGQVISTTTRQPRPGEVDGVDYHFVDLAEFTSKKSRFIEQLQYDGNLYGVSSSELDRLSAGGFENVVIVAEPNGVSQISKWAAANCIKCASAYLHVPQHVCYSRLLERFIHDSSDSRFQRYSNRLVTMNSEFLWLYEWQSIDWHIISVSADDTPEMVASSLLSLS